MAEVRIEKTSGMPWWTWALLAVVVIGIGWYFIAADDTRASNEPANTVYSGATADQNEFSTLIPLYAPPDPAALAGRSVSITEPVRVLSVTGDQTFWVGQDRGQQVLVVLDESGPGGTYDVAPGQTVKIWGNVQQFPGFEEAQRRWNVNPSVRSELENQKIYIHAERLEIMQRP